MPLTCQELGLEGATYVVTDSDFVSEVMKEIFHSREFPLFPRRAPEIVSELTELYTREFTDVGGGHYSKTFATESAIEQWLTDNLLQIPSIQELNLSQNRFDVGIPVDTEFVAVPGHDGVDDPAEDYVDLDALVTNIAHNIVRNTVDIDFSTIE